MLLRVDLPEFLDTNAEFRHIESFGEVELGNDLLGKMPAHTFSEEGVLAQKRHAARIGVLHLAIAADTHIAGCDADDGTFVVVEHFLRGKAGVNLDTEGFCLGREPTTEIAERNDVIAVIIEQFRHSEIRQSHRASRAEEIEPVIRDRRFHRTIGIIAPIRDQLVETDRVDHRTGKDMRANLGAFFHKNDRDLLALLGSNLFQPDRR